MRIQNLSALGIVALAQLACVAAGESTNPLDGDQPLQEATGALNTNLTVTVSGAAVVVEGTLSMPPLSYCGCSGGGDELLAAPADSQPSGTCDGTNFFHLDIRKVGWSNSTFSPYASDCSLSNRNSFYLGNTTTYVAGRAGDQSPSMCVAQTISIRYTFPTAAGTQTLIPDEDLSDGAQDYVLYSNLAGQTSYPGIGPGDYTVAFLPWFTGKANGCNTTLGHIYSGNFGSADFAVGNPPASPAQVGISGTPSAIKPQPCSFTATASGFIQGSSKTYVWEVSSSNPGADNWSSWYVARSHTTTSTTDSRAFTMSIADIRQRVTVTSGGTTAVSPIFYTWYGGDIEP